MRQQREVNVTIGNGIVVLRYAGCSNPTVAKILGMECNEAGEPCKIWLDRLVHQAHESNFGEWSVSGPIVSVLTRATRAITHR